MGRLNRRGAGRLCRFLVDSGQLPRFCAELEALPGYLLPLIRTGLYRPAPRRLTASQDDWSVSAAFADLLDADLPLVLIRLRCTQRVRLILEEYALAAGPFLDVVSVGLSWLDPDRFDQGAHGEFWSLARCLSPGGTRMSHRETGWRRRKGAPG